MQHVTMPVSERDLPPGHDWLVIRDRNVVIFAYRQGMLTARTLATAWRAAGAIGEWESAPPLRSVS